MSQRTIFSRCFIFFVLFFMGFGGEVIAQGDYISYTSDECENKIKFKANFDRELTPASPTQTDKPYRTYFWDFGDGNFSMEESPTHIFPASSNSYTVTLQATRMKSDDEIEDLIVSVPIECGNCECEQIPNPIKMEEGECLRLDMIRSPKAGQPVTYILTYQNTCGNIQSGNISLNTNINSPLTVKHYDNQNPSSYTSSLNFSGLQPNEQRNIFISTIVDANLSVGTPIDFKANIFFAGCECETPFANLKRETVKSHDPNLKFVSQEYLCPKGSISCTGETLSRTLKYTIRCQNIGNGAADFVKISDVLHPYLDWSTFNYVSNNHEDICPSCLTIKNDGNGNIEFIFKNVDLEGTNQDGYGIDFRDEDTWGEIVYTVEVKEELPACGSILNQAVVVFDCHQPMTTNVATTLIQNVDCCDCNDICGLPPIVQDTLTVTDPIMGVPLPVSQDFITCINPIMNSLSYQWYPSTSLNSTTILQPIANPQDTTTYTLTVFDGNSHRAELSEVIVFPFDACSWLAMPDIQPTGVIVTNNPSLEELSVNSSGMGACYQWFKNGVLMDNKTDSSLQITDYGSYFVEYTERGCTKNSNIVDIVPVSIEETPTFNFSILPNFTQDEVQVKINAPQPLKAEIALFNLQGKRLTKSVANISKTTTKTLHLGDYPSGMYIVVVGDGKYTASQKVFKY